LRHYPHVFDDTEIRSLRLRKWAYIGVGGLMAFTLWASMVGSATGRPLDQNAFAVAIAIGCLCAAAALSLEHAPAAEEKTAPTPLRQAPSDELMSQLRQDLKDARQNGEVVALMLVDITRGGDMPQWARADQLNRVERILKVNAVANYDVYRLDDTQFALTLTHPQAINKMLDIADLLQRPTGRNGPEERLSRAYLTFGLAADHHGRGTPEGLVRSANVALNRALNLQTGRYIILEESIPS
jgi:GGDEF domain-containing protein